MSNDEDEKALQLLEQAVYKAQKSLEKIKQFQPFLMLLSATGEVEIFENEIENCSESYEVLQEILVKRLKQNNIDIMLLVVDSKIPERYVAEASSGIRVHLEEKSQRSIKIGARFIYVPYILCNSANEGLFVKLLTPIPVSFRAEYIL